MAEKFTWECLWQAHCSDCKVAQYVKEHELDDSQQEDLMNLASAAGARYAPGMASEQLIGLVQEAPSGSSIPLEKLTVAVEGLMQWEDRNCRGNIRGILNHLGIGEY